jgi:branched-chain amino acid aminotransferase
VVIIEREHAGRRAAAPETVAAVGRLQELFVWKNGEVRSGRDAVSVWDHGLLYGDGIFEGIRLRDGWLYRPDLHFVRLRRSAAIVGLDIDLTDDELLRGIAAVAEANRLRDAHVRVVCTRGVGLPGLDPRRCIEPTVYILAYPFPPYLGETALSVIVSNVVRKSPRSVDAAVKSLNYLDGILAKMQANAAGAGEALMLDGEGFLAEATAANVFVIRDGELQTPLPTACLAGVTRRTVLELARELGVATHERRLSVGDLYAADEAFLTGTAAGIVPIGTADGRRLRFTPGPVTTQLVEAYAATWHDPQYAVEVVPADARPEVT